MDIKENDVVYCFDVFKGKYFSINKEIVSYVNNKNVYIYVKTTSGIEYDKPIEFWQVNKNLKKLKKQVIAHFDRRKQIDETFNKFKNK